MDADQITRELEAVRERIDALGPELERLMEVERSLQTLLAHVTGQPIETHSRRDHHRQRRRGPHRGEGLRRGRSRTYAVERVLIEADEAMDRQQIAESLGAVVGEPVDADDVSASLSYLRRAGRARNDDGLWSALEDGRN